MEWTFYKMSVVWFIHCKLREQQQRGELAMHAMASRGDPKTVNRIIAGKERKE